MTEKPTGLTLMRADFSQNQMSKLPKGTKAQNQCPPDQKVNCKVCGGWHHPQIRHLDYVGHAAVTDRLLDCDPEWTWEPVAFGPDGLPALDTSGGLWIRLTVCGVSRLGYGNAQDKDAYSPGDRLKEVIGDAIRNSAMRFGAALELWHKGDLHLPGPVEEDDTQGQADNFIAAIAAAQTLDELREVKAAIGLANLSVTARTSVVASWNGRKAALVEAARKAEEAPA